jgi:hypothetical protein
MGPVRPLCGIRLASALAGLATESLQRGNRRSVP